MDKIGPPYFYSTQSEFFCSINAIFPLMYGIPLYDIPNFQVSLNLTNICDCSLPCALTRFHTPAVKGWGRLGGSRVLFSPWRWGFFGCSWGSDMVLRVSFTRCCQRGDKSHFVQGRKNKRPLKRICHNFATSSGNGFWSGIISIVLWVRPIFLSRHCIFSYLIRLNYSFSPHPQLDHGTKWSTAFHSTSSCLSVWPRLWGAIKLSEILI